MGPSMAVAELVVPSVPMFRTVAVSVVAGAAADVADADRAGSPATATAAAVAIPASACLLILTPCVVRARSELPSRRGDSTPERPRGNGFGERHEPACASLFLM